MRRTSRTSHRSSISSSQSSWKDYVFGFMYDEQEQEEDDEYDNEYLYFDNEYNYHNPNNHYFNDVYDNEGIPDEQEEEEEERSAGLFRRSTTHLLLPRPAHASAHETTNRIIIEKAQRWLCHRSCFFIHDYGPLVLALSLFAAANAVPLSLTSAMSVHFAHQITMTLNTTITPTRVATQLATASVWGLSLGKLLNGPWIYYYCSISNSNRNNNNTTTSSIIRSRTNTCFCIATTMLALSLLLLAASTNNFAIARIACFLVEFHSTMQWPCTLILLATSSSSQSQSHRTNQSHQSNQDKDDDDYYYEGGIYWTSLALRLGALCGRVAVLLLWIWSPVASAISTTPLESYSNSDAATTIDSSASSASSASASSWQIVALFGAWAALLSVAVTYLYVGRENDHHHHYDNNSNHNHDNHHHDHESLQSPPLELKPQQSYARDDSYFYSHFGRYRRTRMLRMMLLLLERHGQRFVMHVVPALKRVVLTSPVFWIVACAHSGGALVRTAERIVPSYLIDTSSLSSRTAFTISNSNSSISSTNANTTSSSREVVWGGMALSLGTVAGLGLAGSRFANQRSVPHRKQLVRRLYMLTLAACYGLALLAVPYVRNHLLLRILDFVWESSSSSSSSSSSWFMLEWLQCGALMAAGFGIAVPMYHVPSWIGATRFASSAADQGLFASYVDGVAYAFAALVWQGLVVGRALLLHNTTEEDSTSSSSSSSSFASVRWAYGWAAVALWLIPCAVVMVEFIHHFFASQRRRSRRNLSQSQHRNNNNNKMNQSSRHEGGGSLETTRLLHPSSS